MFAIGNFFLMHINLKVFTFIAVYITVVARVSKHTTAGIRIGVVVAGTTIRTRIG